jgi:hypothetical protein
MKRRANGRVGINNGPKDENENRGKDDFGHSPRPSPSLKYEIKVNSYTMNWNAKKIKRSNRGWTQRV